MEKIRWGIISTANIARKAMIPALQKIPLSEVLAVASRNLGHAKRFAELLGIPRAYGNYQSLLDDPEIKAVYIPLPNHLHKEWTIRAAEAGKHILCEKPLALNIEECQQMIHAALANGVQLAESFMYRYHPRIKAAVDMVRSGMIGPLKIIDTGFTFHLRDKNVIRYKSEMGGGALMDVGCYCVSISRLMAGRNPNSVLARAIWGPTDVDIQLVGIMDFGDGVIAHFDCAFNQSSRQHCTLSATEGYFSLPNVFNPGEEQTAIQAFTNGQLMKTYKFKGVNEYTLIAQDFIDSIAGDQPEYSIQDSIENMQVIQALLKSARLKGQVIDL